VNIAGLRRLRADDIEERSQSFIRLFDENVLLTQQPTPVISIVERLKAISPAHPITFDFNYDLACTPLGGKILGQFFPKSYAICIDESLLGTDRLNFALAHEIGHLVLHRKCTFENTRDRWEDTDEVFDVITGKKILETDEDWAEWQANRFASSFLMPSTTFRDELVKIQEEMGITRRGYIYLDEQQGNRRDFKRIVKDLAYRYQVNRTNVIYRLKDLGYLDDMRLASVVHISQVFADIL
jgi:Zn-dependent peptidase ImmA (M78 family)